jgi:hypothetical protein
MGYLLVGEMPKIIEVDRTLMRKINTLLEWLDNDDRVWEYLKKCKYRYDEKKK